MQCCLGRSLPPHQVASWSIQPFGHNKHGPKIGAVPLWGRGAGSLSNTLLLRNCAVDFVKICNVYFGKMIIKAAKRIFNSDKICRSYCDFYLASFFGTQCRSDITTPNSSMHYSKTYYVDECQFKSTKKWPKSISLRVGNPSYDQSLSTTGVNVNLLCLSHFVRVQLCILCGRPTTHRSCMHLTSNDPTGFLLCAVFTARRSYASAVMGVVILSVCPIVTRMLCE